MEKIFYFNELAVANRDIFAKELKKSDLVATAWGSYHFKGTPKDDKPLVLVFRYQTEDGETLSVVWNLAKKQAHFLPCFVRVQKSESKLTCYGQLFCELDEKNSFVLYNVLKGRTLDREFAQIWWRIQMGENGLEKSLRAVNGGKDLGLGYACWDRKAKKTWFFSLTHPENGFVEVGGLSLAHLPEKAVCYDDRSQSYWSLIDGEWINPRSRKWTSITNASEVWKVFLQRHPKESRKISSYLQPVAAYWYGQPCWVLAIDNNLIYLIMVEKALQVVCIVFSDWENLKLALPGDKKFFYD